MEPGVEDSSGGLRISQGAPIQSNPTKFREGNVLTPVYDSVQRRGACIAKGGVRGEGAYVW